MKINNFIFLKKTLYINSIMVYYYFGVKRKSYLGSVITRIYDFYCRGAKNLFIEYKRYYRKEYKSYRDFLLKKYNLFEHELDELYSKLLYCKCIEYIKDYNIEQLCENEEIKELLIDFLGGKVYEG